MLKGMPPQPENRRFDAQHAAMGTVYSIAAYAPSSICIESAFNEAFCEIDRLDVLMSHHRPSSELCAINREAAGKPMPVSSELFALIENAFRISVETGGAFDVTVGPLMKTWGFFRRNGRVPNDDELTETQARTGYSRVSLDPEAKTIAFERPGMELDLGAIGKGYAVDCAANVMRKHGVHNALISSGSSSIAALGTPPGERGWPIALCDPRDRRKTSRVLRLSNLSISISGSYEQIFVINGRAYTHLLDPRSGRPVEGMLMAALIGPSNTLTDALSTALFVLGVEGSREFLEQRRDLTALLFRSAGREVEQIVFNPASEGFPAESFVDLGEGVPPS